MQTAMKAALAWDAERDVGVLLLGQALALGRHRGGVGLGGEGGDLAEERSEDVGRVVRGILGEILEEQVVVEALVGGEVVLERPLGRAGRDDEASRRHQVGFEAAVWGGSSAGKRCNVPGRTQVA